MPMTHAEFNAKVHDHLKSVGFKTCPVCGAASEDFLPAYPVVETVMTERTVRATEAGRPDLSESVALAAAHCGTCGYQLRLNFDRIERRLVVSESS